MGNTADNSLPDAEERFRALLMASSDVVYRMSADWRQMRYLCGRDFIADTDSPSDAWLQNYIPPDEQSRVLAVIDEAIRTKSIFELEHRVVRVDGTLGWTLSRAVPMLDLNGDILEWIGAATDVTQRRLLEQQIEEHTKELQARSHDLARLAEELTLTQYQERRRLADHLHDDLQQLLVAAQMKTKSLSSGSDSRRGDHLKALADILQEAIKTTRTLTRELAPPLSLAGNLCNAFEWLVHDANERYGVTLNIHLTGNLDEVPEAECVLLYTATRELLTNVVKHSGALQAEVELARRDQSIALSIRDAGHGFDKESVETSNEGFGLLSIRERVHLLGGEFTVNTGQGRGVEAAIEIPIRSELPASSRSRTPVRPETAALISTRRVQPKDPIRVLLVDDHRIVREALGTLLGAEDGVTIVGECGDGRQAIDSAGRLEPQVVIMDINMPVMDGVEATRLIKERWPVIKIIGLSMYSDVEMGRKIREAGADAFLTKSVPPEELIAAIHRCGDASASQGPAGGASLRQLQ